MRKLKQGRVYDIHYRIDTLAPEAIDDMITGYWTGEVDVWGKMTIKPVVCNSPEHVLYLFPDEILGATPA